MIHDYGTWLGLCLLVAFGGVCMAFWQRSERRRERFFDEMRSRWR